MNKIKHTIKDYKDYDIDLYKDYVYFAKDKKQIIVNGVEYGFDLESEDNLVVESISIDGLKLTIKYTNGKTKEVKLKDPDLFWEELILIDEEEIPNDDLIKS